MSGKTLLKIVACATAALVSFFGFLSMPVESTGIEPPVAALAFLAFSILVEAKVGAGSVIYFRRFSAP